MDTSNENTHIILVLDESGSMTSMGDETIQAVNLFITDQKNSLQEDESRFTLIKFNSQVKVEMEYVLLKDVHEFTEYNPTSMTALNDSIGKAIEIGKSRIEKVVVVILTDGMENCSHHYSSMNIKQMIQETESDLGWQFVYLAANQDACFVGQHIGIKVNNCADFECVHNGIVNITRSASSALSAYRSGSTPQEINVRRFSEIVEVSPCVE